MTRTPGMSWWFRSARKSVSAPVFWFTLVIATGTGILLGVFPAAQCSRADPRDGLHEGGRGAALLSQKNY